MARKMSPTLNDLKSRNNNDLMHLLGSPGSYKSKAYKTSSPNNQPKRTFERAYLEKQLEENKTKLGYPKTTTNKQLEKRLSYARTLMDRSPFVKRMTLNPREHPLAKKTQQSRPFEHRYSEIEEDRLKDFKQNNLKQEEKIETIIRNNQLGLSPRGVKLDYNLLSRALKLKTRTTRNHEGPSRVKTEQ